MTTNLEQRVARFQQLNVKNDEALELLGTLTSTGSITADHMDTLFSRIKEMEDSLSLENTSPFYEGLEKNKYKEALHAQVTNIKKRVKAKMRPELYSSDHFESPAVRSQIAGRVRNILAGLNPLLEGDFEAGAISFKDLQTPHDCIRYLHRVGTELFYDPNGGHWDTTNRPTIYKEWNKFHLDVVVLGETDPTQYLQQNHFLTRFVQIVDSKKFSSKRKETDYVRGIGSNETLSLQLPLGCHYATLQLKQERDCYKLRFRFTDTTAFNSSAFRSNVSERILKALGYNVQRNNNVMDIHATYGSIDDAVNSFEELLRFSVSLADLDICYTRNVIGREDDIIAAYLAGVIHLRKYVDKCKPGNYAEFAKAEGCYRGEEVVAVGEKGEYMPAQKIEVPTLSYWSRIKYKVKTAANKASYIWRKSDPYLDFRDRIEMIGFGLLAGFVIGGAGSCGVKELSTPVQVPKTEQHEPNTYTSLQVCDTEIKKEPLFYSVCEVGK